MKNLGNLMKQAQEMQAKMAEMQDRLAELTVEGVSGGGMVTITLSGKSEMKGIRIDPALLNGEEGEILEDLIVAAHADAKSKAEQRTADEMKELTGGLNLPPGFNMPFGG
ncbi:MAG: YbaB/EbfC family nucleoid-associated protein [Alphaproteobacteria bacterium]|jgi:nucleoid-associated protein EbfC